MGSKQRNLINEKFGRLTVIKSGPPRNYNGSIKKQWICKCDCGKEVLVNTGALTTGNTTSCGCYKAKISVINGTNSRHKVAKTDASYNSVYSSYRSNATSRNLEFSITKEQFKEIVNKNCYYCNVEPSNYYNTSYYSLYYNGIDRIDNKKGYTFDNVVPCCKTCNIAKNNNDSNFFEKWAIKLGLHSIKRKNLEYMEKLQELIKENPNDTELGAKIRQIYGLNDDTNK